LTFKQAFGSKKIMKNPKILTIALVSTLLLMSALDSALMDVNGQSNATVTVLTSVGGTVSPSGTNTYPDGTTVTFTATSDNSSDFTFLNWVVTGDNGDSSRPTSNPLSLTVVGGVTYTVQAVFDVLLPAPGTTKPTEISQAAVVVILPSAGGITDPPMGTYVLPDVSTLDLTAIPQEGWQFAHWTICGANTNHGGAPVNLSPTDNPYNVNHGYGYTYYYQAVFTQVGSSEPGVTSTPASGGTAIAGASSDYLIIGLIVVIVIVLVAFGIYAMRRKK
jgi:hypothetical protein